MALTIRLDAEKDTLEIGNDDIGFAKFECTSKDVAWGRRLAEHLEEEGIDIDLEEADEEEEAKPKKSRR